MRAFLKSRASRVPERPSDTALATTSQGQPRTFGEVWWFVPARWLVVAVAIVRHFFGRKRISKLGIAALVWSVTPRSLKVAVAGFAGVATIVFLGAIASITLLVLQLT